VSEGKDACAIAIADDLVEDGRQVAAEDVGCKKAMDKVGRGLIGRGDRANPHERFRRAILSVLTAENVRRPTQERGALRGMIMFLDRITNALVILPHYDIRVVVLAVSSRSRS